MLQPSEDEIENVLETNEHLFGESISPGHLIQTRLPNVLLKSKSSESCRLFDDRRDLRMIPNQTFDDRRNQITKETIVGQTPQCLRVTIETGLLNVIDFHAQCCKALADDG